MKASPHNHPSDVEENGPAVRPNGSGAAAILATGIGSLTLSVLALLGDKSVLIKRNLVFYTPTGPLSGVTTVAILIWMIAWILLDVRWRNRAVAMGKVNVAAFTLLAMALILTFPPVVDAL